ncbi:hypothetical protein UFOVP60_7 [uncultured Caudovirales phage]|uniref:Uncharacterized protein n=1 Tax=uncultured Caudovirales phage TaxID=2100421 RepID=A0A6J5T8S7_9CAUD|nr:hypothetical protein UFOVP60_7 [uncultured Caudovirales phage]
MINVGVAGRFKLEAINEETGERRELAPWFNNLITDQGLNHLGTSGIGQYCLVGTGSTTPSETDTTLANKLAHTTTNAGVTYGGQATTTYYSWVRVVFRFAAGVAAGNLTELGVGISTTLLFSRTLIKDGSGNPTTITVLPSEALDVTYELRMYAPSADTTHTTVIGGVPYTGVVRPSLVTNSGNGDAWGVRSFVVPSSLNGISPTFTVFSGAVGAVTAGPSGTQETLTGSVAESVYSQNSLNRSGTITCPLSEGNLAGGIGAVAINTTLGRYQIGFSPSLPKDATKVLTLSFTLSWNRMVI